MKLAHDIPAQGPAPLPFVHLPVMGIMASTRRLGEHTVKLLLMGNLAGAGHTHEDKGSFVLEFAGETFAMDPGTCDYSNPLAALLKNCERHNMLVPSGLDVRPAPECPLSHDVRPVGSGDATSFRAEIDAAHGCTWRVDELPLAKGVQRRLALRYPGPSGVVQIKVRLITA